MAAYQEKLPEFEAQGVQVVGLSADPPELAEAFRKDLGLTFMILCDTEKKVIREWDRYSRYEMGGIAKASLFLIDGDRRVQFRTIESIMHHIRPEDMIDFLKSGRGAVRPGQAVRRFTVPGIASLLLFPPRMLRNIFRKKGFQRAVEANEDEERYGLIPLVDEEDLDNVLDAPLAIIYKHSPLCGLSSGAIREVKRFKRDHPDVSIYIVDVIGSRAIANEIESRTGVRHQSPQAILIAEGKVRWHDSHRGVNGEALAAQLEDLAPQS